MSLYYRQLILKTHLCLLLAWWCLGNLYSQSRYLLPTATILSGNKNHQIALDLVVSEHIFHADRGLGGIPIDDLTRWIHLEKLALSDNTIFNSEGVEALRRAMEKTKLTIISPNGTSYDSTPIVNFGAKSVAKVDLQLSGTYRIGVVSEPSITTTYVKADGTRGRAVGVKDEVEIPEGSSNIQTRISQSRSETFVSRNGMTLVALAPTGMGIELGEGTHPNDFFVGEKIVLSFLYEGRPMVDADVVIVKDGTKHRNQRNEIKLMTDQHGVVAFQLSEAGFYFLETRTSVTIQEGPVDIQTASYSATFEVWPE